MLYKTSRLRGVECRWEELVSMERSKDSIYRPELTTEVKSPNVVTVLRGFPLCFSLSKTDIKVVLGKQRPHNDGREQASGHGSETVRSYTYGISPGHILKIHDL